MTKSKKNVKKMKKEPTKKKNSKVIKDLEKQYNLEESSMDKSLKEKINRYLNNDKLDDLLKKELGF